MTLCLLFLDFKRRKTTPKKNTEVNHWEVHSISAYLIHDFFSKKFVGSIVLKGAIFLGCWKIKIF